LRSDIVNERDFKVVNFETWKALNSWYGGGPPLPRFVKLLEMKPGSDLYSQLIKNSNPNNRTTMIDLWPNNIPSLSDILEDMNSSIRDSKSSKAIIRVKSFNMNDCGLSATQSSFSDTDPTSVMAGITMDETVGPTEVMMIDDDEPLSIPSSSSSRYDDRSLSSRRADLNQINTCFTCRAVASTHCSKCKAVYYCSIPCQKVRICFKIIIDC
jgi:hypothetical protein